MRIAPRLAIVIAAGIALFVALAVPGGAAAAPGAVDASYGRGGYSIPVSGGTYSFAAHPTAVGSAGAIALVGAQTSFRLVEDEDEDDFSFDIRVHPTVWRYRADGAPDTAWGTNGAAKIYLQNHLGIATGIAPQADGSMYVIGANVGLFSLTGFVARLDSTGKLDTSFGTSGATAVLPEQMNALFPVGLRVLSDGKLLVAATTFTGDIFSIESDPPSKRRADFDVALLRFNTNGTLDTTFGDGGVRSWESSGVDSIDFALTAEPGPDDSLVVGGTSFHTKLESARGLVARFTRDGGVDRTFGRRGSAPQPLRGDTWDMVTSLDTAADGGVLAGVVRLGDESRSYVRRFDLTGRTPLWGVDGRPLPIGFYAGGLTALPDGRTYIGGGGSRWADEEPSDEAGVVTRLNADGHVDRSFDAHGSTAFGRRASSTLPTTADAVVPQADGSIITGGTVDGVAGLVRLYADAPAGAEHKATPVRLALATPQRTRCGGTRARACVINGEQSAPVRMRVDADGIDIGARLAYLQVSEGTGYWSSWSEHRTALNSSGAARVLVGLREESGIYRVRALVPASRRSASGMSRPFYIRITRPKEAAEYDEWDDEDYDYAKGASLGTYALRACRGRSSVNDRASTLGFMAELSCREIARGKKRDDTKVEFLRRVLGR